MASTPRGGRRPTFMDRAHVRDRAKKRRQYLMLRAEGRCITCWGPAEGDGVRCRACARSKGVQTHAMYVRHRRVGLCGKCGRPARPGRALCDIHGEEVVRGGRTRTRHRKAAGLCITCGLPVVGGRWSRCAYCAARNTEDRWRRLVEHGSVPASQ